MIILNRSDKWLKKNKKDLASNIANGSSIRQRVQLKHSLRSFQLNPLAIETPLTLNSTQAQLKLKLNSSSSSTQAQLRLSSTWVHSEPPHLSSTWVQSKHSRSTQLKLNSNSALKLNSSSVQTFPLSAQAPLKFSFSSVWTSSLKLNLSSIQTVPFNFLLYIKVVKIAWTSSCNFNNFSAWSSASTASK